MTSEFKHYDLQLVRPKFEDPLTDLILELDYLRKKRIEGTTPGEIFLQLKSIFHTLESINSARIEGNKTTIAEHIEVKLDKTSSINQNNLEIINMEKALLFIDTNIKDIAFDRAFIAELHKQVVEGLLPPPDGEGDPTPGYYRNIPVNISGSTHKPPEHIQVELYMEELINFISNEDAPKYDLLKVAVSHHRFSWIHPFRNGNGRTVRLLTYAMLVKLGFKVDTTERILNPSAIFCTDRDKYYEYLSHADTGEDRDILNWCQYVLTGLREEIEKIDHLADYDYLKKEVLLPAINYSLERKYITPLEAKIIKRGLEKPFFKASDLKDIFPGKQPSEVSRTIRRLKDKKMLTSLNHSPRTYVISFDDNFLIRGIIKQLGDKGLITFE